MFKFGSSIYPVGVRVGLLVVSLVFLGQLTASVGSGSTPTNGRAERQAREALNKGVQDFKNGQYDAAAADFQRAKDLNPRLLNARLYLASGAHRDILLDRLIAAQNLRFTPSQTPLWPLE